MNAQEFDQKFDNGEEDIIDMLDLSQSKRPLANPKNEQTPPIEKKKRAAFGYGKDTTKTIGDIVEPTSNLVSWE
jgi:hypothetical protein